MGTVEAERAAPAETLLVSLAARSSPPPPSAPLANGDKPAAASAAASLRRLPLRCGCRDAAAPLASDCGELAACGEPPALELASLPRRCGAGPKSAGVTSPLQNGERSHQAQERACRNGKRRCRTAKGAVSGGR